MFLPEFCDLSQYSELTCSFTMDVAQGDIYTPFYYWDNIANKWEFDYEGFYKTHGYPESSTAARQRAEPTSAELYQQQLQSSVYDYVPTRTGRSTQVKVAGNLKKGETRETVIRRAAGKLWEDRSLLEWDPSHKRLFVGDLGNDVHDEHLVRAFQKYPSFSRARVVRNKSDGKTKGYGFVAFADPEDFLKAWKEMDGKYIGSRPCRLKKAEDNIKPVEIGARKDKFLAANAKYNDYLNKARRGGTVGRHLPRTNGLPKPYSKK